MIRITYDMDPLSRGKTVVRIFTFQMNFFQIFENVTFTREINRRCLVLCKIFSVSIHDHNIRRGTKTNYFANDYHVNITTYVCNIIIRVTNVLSKIKNIYL